MTVRELIAAGAAALAAAWQGENTQWQGGNAQWQGEDTRQDGESRSGSPGLSEKARPLPEDVRDFNIDAGLLYCHVAGLDRTRMILQYREPVTEEIEKTFWELLRRRAAGEPLQYITGQQEFMGLPFHVEPGVLIPRPETELLVERALAWVKASGPRGAEPSAVGADDGGWGNTEPNAVRGINSRCLRVLDIGCGSGAIGVSLAKLLPEIQVTCTDISSRALEIARGNAEAMCAEVEFLRGDLLAPVADRRFDMILSNPPYIARDVIPGLSREVREHEPGEALCGGEDGLDIYRRMIPALPECLEPGGVVMMEIGYDQMEAVKALLEETGAFAKIEGFQDLNGLDRIVSGERKRMDEPTL